MIVIGERTNFMQKVILIMIVCLGIFSQASAAPATTGTTGNIDTPSADVLRPGQASVAYYKLHEGNDLTFGVNVAKNLELSGARQESKNAAAESYLNLKYGVLHEGILTPGVAVGIEDITNQKEQTVYAVISKGLPLGIRAHAGIGNGRYDGLFFAVEKKLIPMSIGGVFPDTSLIIEHNGHAMNYGLRMSIAAGLKVDAGWRDNSSYIGFTYNCY
jgi:hypothetical protein